MKEYQTDFETLANRITGLPPHFLLSCFIYGLKPDIGREIQAFQPISLTHAISLAKLQEDKLNDKTPFRHALSSNTQDFNRSSFKPTVTSAPQKPTTQPLKTTSIKRLSPAELQARRDQGLCHNCDDKFVPGHKCKRRFNLLISDPDEPEPLSNTITQLLAETSTQPTTENEPSLNTESPQISFHALMGHSIPQTLRLLGQIKKTPPTVLIDTGSTHNFIQEWVAKQLNLSLHPAKPFQVLVGNGEELDCVYMCPNVHIILDSHEFVVELFVLPISGAEMALGV